MIYSLRIRPLMSDIWLEQAQHFSVSSAVCRNRKCHGGLIDNVSTLVRIYVMRSVQSTSLVHGLQGRIQKLWRGAEDGVYAPSSFIANAHNELYAFLYGEKPALKIGAARGRPPPPHPFESATGGVVQKTNAQSANSLNEEKKRTCFASRVAWDTSRVYTALKLDVLNFFKAYSTILRAKLLSDRSEIACKYVANVYEHFGLPVCNECPTLMFLTFFCVRRHRCDVHFNVSPFHCSACSVI